MSRIGKKSIVIPEKVKIKLEFNVNTIIFRFIFNVYKLWDIIQNYIFLKIISDWNCVIMHVNAANPGSCNDTYCMNGSQVKFLGERGDFAGFFLLGDSG